MNNKYMIFILIVVSIFVGCDDFKEETYSMTSIDTSICNQLLAADSVAVKVNAIGLDTSFTSMADTISYVASLDSSQIEVSSNPWSVSLSSDTTFLNLSSTGEILIATNGIVDLTLYSNDGQILLPESQSIDLSTISDCSEMKTRYLFNLSSDTHFLRMTESNSQETLFVVMNNE